MSALGRLWRRFWPSIPHVESDTEYEARRIRESEARWRAINDQKCAEGCKCGAPATEVRYNHENVGSVPVEHWTCAEHVGASMWSKERDVWKPYWDRPSPCDLCTHSRCGGSGGPIGGPTTSWCCPDRPVRDD